MMKLLVILFINKVFANIHIFQDAHLKSGIYLEPCETSVMQLHANIVDSKRLHHGCLVVF